MLRQGSVLWAIGITMGLLALATVVGCTVSKADSDSADGTLPNYHKARAVFDAGLLIPHQLSFATGDETLQEWQLEDAHVNADLDESLFAKPEHVEVTTYTPQWRPQRLADGVYAVRIFNGIGLSYNSMFVVFDEYVVVVEAPLNDLFYGVMANIISQVAPGKPIRYVIPTHHHVDHIGGLKAYMANGATVLATPQTAAFAERLAAVEHTLTPNPLVRAETGPRIEVFADTLTLKDSRQELRLYQLGPTPHVDEIVVAYVPGEKIMFVSDLFTVFESRRFAPPTAALKDFAEKLRKLGLDVDTFVPGHGPVSTRGDFENALTAGS